jgi:hypothetical protein
MKAMGNLSGWGLTGRLISKHFGSLGDKVSEAIANFDPETATQADRDRIQDTLRSTAQKLAAARASFDKEHADVVQLQKLVASDEKATETLAARLQAGTISEAAVTMFCDELEANKAKLPEELQQEADANAYMNELQQIVDAFSKQLADFDAVAKKALQQLASANAQKDLQELRSQRQSELDSLKNLGGHSTALDALTRRAQTVSNEAAGMKILTDINQKPIDQAAEIAAIRKSVSEPETAGESTLERLKRLSAKPAA